MRIAVDTNRYRDFCEGVKEVVECFQTATEICLPLIVLAELRAGFFRGTRARGNEAVLVQFLNAPRTRVLRPNDETTHHYARVYGQLRAQGTPIPSNDIWIAALVMQHDVSLCSRDAHFDHLPQLSRVAF